ncbi:hypothetical protein ACI2JA_15755 [Alkalihalobacillus sp. NPDC078783]
MRAYHFLDVESFLDFTNPNSRYSSDDDQLPLEGNDQPSSLLTLTTKDYYEGFQKYVIVHEKLKKKSGRAYDQEILFKQFIESKNMNAYYHPEKKLLLVEGDKGGVNGWVRRFSKVFGDKFRVSRSNVDFPYLVKHSENVWGGWISGFNDGSLKSVALFGDHVNLNEDYSRLEAAGKLSSLNCALTFEKKSYDFTITANKTVVIMQNQTSEQDLDLLMHLKPILYKEI